MRHLQGKRVLITGAGQGIGRSLALALARRGAKLILTDIRADLLPPVASAVQSAGAVAATYPLDVTQHESILELRSRIFVEQGPLDVLINNAGLVFGGLFWKTPLDRHLQTYEVNTFGLVAMTHAFLADLIERPEAHVVNIASAAGFIGLPYGSTYASSKWAVIGFSESLRLELAEQGFRHVKVTTVCPSYVSTGLFDGAKAPRTLRFLKPDDLAVRIVRSVERDKAFLLAPAIVHLTPFLAGILPRRLLDHVARWFRINTSMQHWRGRQQHDAIESAPRCAAAETANLPPAQSLEIDAHR